jgi:hypothetical protein
MTSPHSPRLVDLLPAFALGALDGEELRELAAHLAAGCPACDAELRRLADDLEALALAAVPLGSPLAAAADAGVAMPAAAGEGAEILERTRRQLLEQVAAEARVQPGAPTAPIAPTEARGRPATAPPPARSSPRRLAVAARWGWLAAAALLLVAGWGVARQARLGGEIERLHAERGRLAARADALERRMGQVQAEAERLARTLSIVAAPGVQSVELVGMGAAGRAVGRTYINAAERRAAFYASRLPALGPGKSYELWFIDDDERKIPAGIFEVDARGDASVLVDQPLPLERIQAWVVTIEPRGGRAQPTGPIALAGQA